MPSRIWISQTRLIFLLILFPLLWLFLDRTTSAKAEPIHANPKAGPTPDWKIPDLLTTKCLRCHGGESRKADFDVRTLEALIRGGESGQGIIPGHPEKSLLLEKIQSGEMPPGKKDSLTPAEQKQVEKWIAGLPKTDSNRKDASAGTLTQHDIIPIVLRHCTVCHGRHRQEGGLDLRTKDSMLRGGKSGPALIPGKPDESRMIQRVRAGQMPPNNRLVEVSVKPVDPSELETLSRWIAQGAPEVNLPPDVATTTPDPLVTDKDRDFWSFRAPKSVAIPRTVHSHRVNNPIDAFVLKKLEDKGLGFSKEADRNTLIRRVYFDLAGLPPEPADLQSYLQDKDPQWYQKMIDKLLASPRYGERWARYWLDAIGYSDSEGKREQDLPRPYAWRYRDYVIRAFQTDKPYDRFLMEQLAGDELADYENGREITPEIYDNLVATGFLRMVPDATWANITGYVNDRIEVIADEVDVLGSAIMGLTLKCARCHTHKFDPIPHRDYYRLVDVFKGALDEYDWLKPEVKPGIGPASQDFLLGRHIPFVTTTERKAWEEKEKGISKQISNLNQETDKAFEAAGSSHLEKALGQFPDPLRADLKLMLSTPAEKRTPAQRKLAETHEKQLRPNRETLAGMYPELNKKIRDTGDQIRGLEAQRQPEPRIQALWDRGNPTPTYIYRRGDSQNPGKLVGPGVPSVLTDGKTPFEVSPPWPGAQKTGRRLAFAKWITRPDHPLTARVAVNRIWKLHFGTGIVKTLGNFGKTGSPPSHPELLDWLAREFADKGWSIKHLHRLVLNSSTYKQDSDTSRELLEKDPDNKWLSRMPMQRLDAEAIYDTMLLVSGRLDERRFGPADRVQARPDGLVTPTESGKGWRRLIYIRQARKEVATHLETFDFPQMNPNCLERRDSIVAPQALHMMNNRMVFDLALNFAKRVKTEMGNDPSKQVDRVYQIALSRPPDREELELGVTTLGKLTSLGEQNSLGGASIEKQKEILGEKALASFCHAILNSAGFLYVD